MRKRPMQGGGGYGGGHKKRYGGHGGGSGGGHHSQGSYNRGARRNWPQTREKYLAQARDAMSAGDRVLAENYLQHADHCWRMMMEEGSHRPRVQGAPGQPAAENGAPPQEEPMPENTNALPSFITTPYGQPQQQQQQSVDPATIQNWEERDA